MSQSLTSPAYAAQRREAAAQFEALLFASALRPLADALGFYGEAVTGALAGGLADALARAQT